MHFGYLVLGYFIITEMDIHIPLKGTFQEKIEHFMQFTGYGYISAAAVYTI